MRVEIRFRGPLASKVGLQIFRKNVEEGAKLGVMLQTLIDTEEAVRKIWDDPERMDREALILRNGTDIGLIGGLDTVLDDEDSILVLPLVHGG